MRRTVTTHYEADPGDECPRGGDHQPNEVGDRCVNCGTAL